MVECGLDCAEGRRGTNAVATSRRLPKRESRSMRVAAKQMCPKAASGGG